MQSFLFFFRESETATGAEAMGKGGKGDEEDHALWARIAETATPLGKSRVMFRRRISGVFPMLDSIESPFAGRSSSFNSALDISSHSRFQGSDKLKFVGQ